MSNNAELSQQIQSLSECVRAWSTPDELKSDIRVLSFAVSKLSTLPDDIKEIKLALNGNGRPETGLVVRVDRLETWSGSIRRWGGVVLSAIILAGLGLIGALLIFDTPLAIMLGKR